MDRLHLVIAVAVAVAVAGCGDRDAKDAPSSGRVNAVRGKAPAAPAADVKAFCDVHHASGGPTFELPEMAEPVAAPATGSWRWVNVWATWCKPCIEELPRLRAWSAKLGERGPAVDLVLVSVDEDAETVAAFAAKHGSVDGTGRVADPDNLKPWLASVGLDDGAPLPIHLFVDPSGAVRCARSGAIAERDFDSIAALVR